MEINHSCLKVWLLQVLKSTFFLNFNPLEKIIILIRKIKYVNLSKPGDLMLSKHWQTSLIKSLNINNVYNYVWKLWTMLLDLFVENSSAGFTLKWLPPTLLCDKVIKLFQRMHQDSIGRDVGAISGDSFYPVFIINMYYVQCCLPRKIRCLRYIVLN